MLRPTAIDVEVLEGHKLLVTFDNGERRIFDVTPYIRGEWYSQLADDNYFKTVRTNGYSLVWRDGQDLCPDEIYYSSSIAH